MGSTLVFRRLGGKDITAENRESRTRRARLLKYDLSMDIKDWSKDLVGY